MKNIRVYTPDIYKGENYIKVKDNIYKTVIEVEEDDNGLSLDVNVNIKMYKFLKIRMYKSVHFYFQLFPFFSFASINLSFNL